MHREDHSHEHDSDAEHGYGTSHAAPDGDIELWGHDSDRAEFVEGHYGSSRSEPTPEGGQAGIAQGNTAARAKAPGRGTARRTGRDESRTERETDARGTARGDTLNDRGTDIYDET